MRGRVVALGCAVALGTAASVQADPGVDASFVDALTKAGISFNDPQNAINAGKTACGLLNQGKPQIDVVALVMQQNSNIGTESAAKFTAIAASAYCPQHLKRAGDNGGGQPLPSGGGVGASGGSQQ